MEQDKIHLTQNNTNKSTVPCSDIDKTLDNTDKSKINKLKTSMLQNENDNSNTVVKRAAASLANADKILKRARSVEPPKSNPPEMEKRMKRICSPSPRSNFSKVTFQKRKK